MIPIGTNTTDYDLATKWQAFLDIYKDDMLSKIAIWFNSENINGVSCKQFDVKVYHLAFIQAFEIYKYHIHNPTLTWSEVSTYFDITNKTKYLIKHNISFSKVLNIFSLPF